MRDTSIIVPDAEALDAMRVALGADDTATIDDLRAMLAGLLPSEALAALATLVDLLGLDADADADAPATQPEPAGVEVSS